MRPVCQPLLYGKVPGLGITLVIVRVFSNMVRDLKKKKNNYRTLSARKRVVQSAKRLHTRVGINVYIYEYRKQMP